MADWILEIIESLGYIGLAMLMLLENLFPPIPSELVMPLAGIQVGTGSLAFPGVVIAGTVGSLLGAWLFYAAGRAYGEQRLRALLQRHGHWLGVQASDIDLAKAWFDRYGALAVFACRLIPGLRSLISIPAGLAGQRMLPFTLYTTAGSALWCALLAWAGLRLNENVDQLVTYLNPIGTLVIGVLLIAYLRRIWSRHKRKTEATDTPTKHSSGA